MIDVVIRCCHLMLSFHIVITVSDNFIQCHIVFHLKLLSNFIECNNLIMTYEVVSHPMLSYGVVKRFCHRLF
jgi:hypothetical protein